MRVAAIISTLITLLLLLSAMICGLWLKAGNPGSLSFHVNCGLAAVGFCCITIVFLIMSLRTKKGR